MKIEQIKGRGLSLRGSDIDTDRILSAKYMKALTFAGVENHLFEAERATFAAEGRVHPLDDPRFQDASILFVNENFGCGSSREHAPQSLKRRGIRAIVGQSFGEIFAGNCAAIGLVTVTAESAAIEVCQALCEVRPNEEFVLDLVNLRLRPGACDVRMAEGVRGRLLRGSADSLAWLLESKSKVEARLSRDREQ